MGTQNLEMLKRYLECASLAMRQKQDRGLSPLFVTLSRQTGAGGLTIAAGIAAYLNERDRGIACPWAVLDKELVQKTLEEHQLPQRVAQYMSEATISEVKDIMEELFGLHPSQWTLVHRMSQTLLHLAKMGNVILVGRAAGVVTRKLEGGLHVRVIAPLEQRLAHVREYYGLGAAEAARFIREEDAGRDHYIRKNFDRRIDDENLYDLVINTEAVSYDEAARSIGDLVLERRNRMCSAAAL